ncbi:hypothetical protein [Alteribacillus bidgolensis]|uniref:Small acid-soluble spore protein (Thioredoxin-like protein) n=1 Tax=Alteribacillus bidgolensis TaxID=930129 RepID=A0A1G8J6H5_9BACI|nr:hypothetical protein [Alteribacillus bidgolensis]SDI26597.1 small acid-soluble spore protein (thioredoxin-like protein) [Alteribacillus bidgolensis]
MMTNKHGRPRQNREEEIKNIIEDTEENLNRTTEFAKEHGAALNEEEMQQIEEKNEHRKETMENLKQSLNKEK